MRFGSLYFLPLFTMKGLTLRPQEIPLDDPRSCCMFQPSAGKPFLATPAAIQQFGESAIIDGLRFLQNKANACQGLDYLQVFETNATQSHLWFIEDGDGGAITALLPDDY